VSLVEVKKEENWKFQQRFNIYTHETRRLLTLEWSLMGGIMDPLLNIPLPLPLLPRSPTRILNTCHYYHHYHHYHHHYLYIISTSRISNTCTHGMIARILDMVRNTLNTFDVFLVILNFTHSYTINSRHDSYVVFLTQMGASIKG